LQRNGKLTYEEIGAMVDRSPSTIRDRIKKLEENKTIMATPRSSTTSGWHKLGRVHRRRHPSRKAQNAIASLFSMENVSEILRVTGERRIMFRIRVPTTRRWWTSSTARSGLSASTTSR
jgi:DNA-binding Lrp family transcriptional regulator